MCKMVSLMILCLIFGIVFESVTTEEILENSDRDSQVDETDNIHKIFKRGIRFRLVDRSTAPVELIVSFIVLGIIGSCYLWIKYCYNIEEDKEGIISNEVPANVDHKENIDNDFHIIKLAEEEQKPKEKQIIVGSESPPPLTYEPTTMPQL